MNYIEQELSKYPYKDSQGTPFRLEQIDEHSWNVFECVAESDYGHFVGFYERQYDFDDCDTLEEALKYWSFKQEKDDAAYVAGLTLMSENDPDAYLEVGGEADDE